MYSADKLRQHGHIASPALTKERDLVLCTSLSDVLEVDIIFDVGADFIPFGDTRPLEITRHPDVSLKIPYNEHSQVPDASGWQTFIPRDEPNTRKVPLITISHREEDLDMMSAAWLNTEDLVRTIKSGVKYISPIGRNIFKQSRPLVETMRTARVWRLGSKGFHEIWIEAQGQGLGWGMNIVPLLSVDYDPSVGHDMASQARPLNLPIDVTLISDILAFCDESTTLAVLTEECDAGCCKPSVRFFEY